MTTLTWRAPELSLKNRHVTLSPMQADVLTGLCLGLSNFQIGRRLHLSEDAIKYRVRTLLAALGATDRTHAVAIARSGQVTVVVAS